MALNTATPILPSLNLAETRDFYTKKLGFAIEGEYPEYLLIGRDGAKLHFWLCDDRKICESSGCYIYCNEIEKFYEECKKAGIVHPNGPLKTTFYNMKEFSALDCHGNLLRIGELL